MYIHLFANAEQHALKDWVQLKVDEEVSRIVGLGQRAIRLSVKNCAIVRQTKDVVNRVEVDTGFDFDRVNQILLSEPLTCPSELKVCHLLSNVVSSPSRHMASV